VTGRMAPRGRLRDRKKAPPAVRSAQRERRYVDVVLSLRTPAGPLLTRRQNQMPHAAAPRLRGRRRRRPAREPDPVLGDEAGTDLERAKATRTRRRRAGRPATRAA